MASIRDNSIRAMIVKFAIWLNFIYFAFYLAVDIINEEWLYEIAFAVAINSGHILVSTFFFWFFRIIAITAFFFWMGRAYYNMEVIKDEELSAFPLPISAFYKPQEALKHIHYNLISFLNRKDEPIPPGTKSYHFISWWWIVLIGALLYNWGIKRFILNGYYDWYTFDYYISHITPIISYAFTFYLVVKMSSLEKRAFQAKDKEDLGLELTGVQKDTNTEKEEEDQDRDFNAPKSSAPGSK